MYLNGAAARSLELRNVQNALGTPASLPVPPDRFWGDPATTRDTFDHFSDFRFLQFCIGFPSNWLRYALFGFLNRQQPPGELANHSMHPISIIPQQVCIFRDFPFSGIRKVPRKLQETDFWGHDRVLKHSPPLSWHPGWSQHVSTISRLLWACQYEFRRFRIFLNQENSRKISRKRVFDVAERVLEHSPVLSTTLVATRTPVYHGSS